MVNIFMAFVNFMSALLRRKEKSMDIAMYTKSISRITLNPVVRV